MNYEKLATCVVQQFSHPEHIKQIAKTLREAMEEDVDIDFRIQIICNPPEGVTIKRRVTEVL